MIDFFNLYTYIYHVFFVLKGRIVPSPPPKPLKSKV